MLPSTVLGLSISGNTGDSEGILSLFQSRPPTPSAVHIGGETVTTNAFETGANTLPLSQYPFQLPNGQSQPWFSDPTPQDVWKTNLNLQWEDLLLYSQHQNESSISAGQ